MGKASPEHRSCATASTEKQTIKSELVTVYKCGKCGATIIMPRFPNSPFNWRSSWWIFKAINNHNAAHHPEEER